MSDTTHVYIRSEPGLWTVGHYAPDDKWHPESDHDSADKAAARAIEMNGGTPGLVADLRRQRDELRDALEAALPPLETAARELGGTGYFAAAVDAVRAALKRRQ